MKTCPNNHENPNDAKFCRVCGQPILVNQEKYTPDCFPDIDLIPTTLRPIQFVFKLEKASYILFPIFVGGLLFILDCKRDITTMFGGDVWEVAVVIGVILSCIFLIYFIVGLEHCWKRIRYKLNADYIEENKFVGETNRIAKNKKLGLFDSSTKRISLRTKYDKIEQFDNQHLLLENNSKIGLYSIPLKKIIIPLKYEQITLIKDGVLLGIKDKQMTHYDIRGNILQ